MTYSRFNWIMLHLVIVGGMVGCHFDHSTSSNRSAAADKLNAPTTETVSAETIDKMSPNDKIDYLNNLTDKSNWTFTVQNNQVLKYTVRQATGYNPPKDETHAVTSTNFDLNDQDLPSKFDWRTSGIVSPVKDQGSCGSCWAFATTAVMESAMALAGGPILDLSEQSVVSCSGNGSCANGGYFAGDYYVNNGYVLESDFKYSATDAKCPAALNHGPKATSIINNSGDRTAVKYLIKTYGPVTTTMYVKPSFQAYGGGVYNDCAAAQGQMTNHMVTIVGWDEAGGYWIGKNSWGTTWGEQGFFRIKYGCDYFGDWVNGAYYPLSKNVPPAPIPSSPTITTTSTSIQVSWSASVGALSYSIERSADGETNWQAIGSMTTQAGQSSYTYYDSSASAGKQYFYRVIATNSYGSTAPTVPVSAALPAANATIQPVSPSNGLAINITNSTYLNSTLTTLNWNPQANVDHYNVYVCLVQVICNWSAPASIPGNSPMALINVTPSNAAGNTYQFRVDAIAASNTVTTGTILKFVYPTDFVTEPTYYYDYLLTAVDASGNVTLTWPAAINAASYLVKRRSNLNDSFALLATVAGTATSYVDSSVATNTPYQYIVQPIAKSGVAGAPYQTQQKSWIAVAAPTPDAPSDLTAAPTSTTSVHLSWRDNSSNETSFRIERSSDNLTWAEIGSTAANVVGFDNTSLAPGTTYYYRVHAANGSLTSANSAVVKMTLPALPTPTPTPTPTTSPSPTLAASPTPTPGVIESSKNAQMAMPVLAANDTGTSAVAWIQSGANSALEAKLLLPPSTDFGVTMTIAAKAGIQVLFPAATVTSDGDVVFVWSELDSTNCQIFSRKYNHKTAQLESPLAISDRYLLTESSCMTSSSFANSNYGAVVWSVSSTDKFRVYVNSYNLKTGGFNASATSIYEAAVDSSHKHIAFSRVGADELGNISVIFNVAEKSGNQISTTLMLRNFIASTSNWNGVATIAKPASGTLVDAANVALRSGSAILAWVERKNSENISMIRGDSFNITTSQTINSAQSISTAADASFWPVVGIDANGNGLMAWLEKPAGNQAHSQLMTSRVKASENHFTTPVAVNSIDPILNVPPTIAVTANGDATLSWARLEDFGSSIMTAAFNGKTGVFADAKQHYISDSTKLNVNPLLVINPSNAGILIWTGSAQGGSTPNELLMDRIQ